MGGETYLAMANGYDGSSYNIYSKIYKWACHSFIEIQVVPTSGAWDWESFFIDGGLYLAVANGWDGTTNSLNSEIFRKETPTAHAGKDLMSFDSVNLDGSGSRDFADGYLTDWQWTLSHREEPAIVRIAAGETALVVGLVPGFYTVSLTVTDNDGFTDRDEATLAAFGTKGDFDSDGDVDGEDLAKFSSHFGR